MQTVLAHDWLTGMRGGERVLHEIASRFPGAPLATLFHVPGACSPLIEDREITASSLSRWPTAKTHYRKLLPLFPRAVRSLSLPPADLVLSTHHAVIKAVPLPEGAVQLCYCFTPMRYVWDQADAYLGRGLKRGLATPLLRRLRRFDRETAGPSQVHRFVAISHAVAERVRRHYRRPCSVVAPPVDVARVRPDGRTPDDFFLLVGGFVPYKRDAIAIEAFRASGRRLVVVGDGPTRARALRALPPNIEYRGRVSDAELAILFARCRALVYPQEEDFGITAVEAQAAGRPVIALGRGGALDSVHAQDDDDGPRTGILYEDASAAGLAAAVSRFEHSEQLFDPRSIRQWAERFGPERFWRQFDREIDATLGAAPAA